MSFINKPKGYHVELIVTKDEFKTRVNELTCFLKTTSNHSHFQNPYIILAECKRKPHIHPFVILIRQQGNIVGVASGFIEKKTYELSFSVKKIGVLPSRILTFQGNTLAFIEDDKDKKDILNTFIYALEKYRQHFDLIALNEIEITSYFWQHAKKQLNKNSYFRLYSISTKEETCSLHELYPSYDDWYRSLRAKTRKRISWEQNRFLKRAPQPIILQHIQSGEDIPNFMRHVLEVRSNSWQGKTLRANKHSLESEIAYYFDLAEHGWLRCYLLLCNGQAAAYELAIQYNQKCIFLERAYRQDMYRLAPGTYLTYHIVKDCYDRDSPNILNFGFGENDFKKRLRTKTIASCYACITKPNRWRMLIKGQQSLNFTEKHINRLLTKMKLDRHVRNFLKHKK